VHLRRVVIVLAASCLALAGLPSISSAAPVVTSHLTVRVQANAAKWVSSEVGGATVVIKDASTGQVLRSGRVVGTSGETTAIMNDPRTPLEPTPTLDEAASVTFSFGFSRPRRLLVEAYGPLVGPTPVSQTSAQVWIVPGDDQNLAVTLHGLIVTVLSPAPHTLAISTGPVQMGITASVQMLCGCPVSTTTPWTPDLYRVRALIRAPGAAGQAVTLAYQSTDTFIGSVTFPGPGMYDVIVVADMPGSGNTGSSSTSVVIAP
jgi:hypothetical protein